MKLNNKYRLEDSKNIEEKLKELKHPNSPSFVTRVEETCDCIAFEVELLKNK